MDSPQQPSNAVTEISCEDTLLLALEKRIASLEADRAQLLKAIVGAAKMISSPTGPMASMTTMMMPKEMRAELKAFVEKYEGEHGA
jgi:hypothetical protein